MGEGTSEPGLSRRDMGESPGPGRDVPAARNPCRGPHGCAFRRLGRIGLKEGAAQRRASGTQGPAPSASCRGTGLSAASPRRVRGQPVSPAASRPGPRAGAQPRGAPSAADFDLQFQRQAPRAPARSGDTGPQSVSLVKQRSGTPAVNSTAQNCILANHLTTWFFPLACLNVGCHGDL